MSVRSEVAGLEHPSLTKLKPKSPKSKRRRVYKPQYSNEEVVQRRIARSRSISLVMRFYVYDEDGKERILRGRNLWVKYIPTAGKLWEVVSGVKKAVTGVVTPNVKYYTGREMGEVEGVMEVVEPREED